jgi:Fic-DOC domain mobile mystery protein B
MKDVLGPEDDASTPLSHEELQGLRLSYITFRHELNEAEQANILAASQRARRRKFVLSEQNLNRLHDEMFGDVWNWAGAFRTTNKNIGVPYHEIAERMRVLLDDCIYWQTHATYPLDQIAARFHHRLVQIHPYPNGNGRHARLAADRLLESTDKQAFTWGSVSLISAGETRARYIAALKAADNHDYQQLFAFVRS